MGFDVISRQTHARSSIKTLGSSLLEVCGEAWGVLLHLSACPERPGSATREVVCLAPSTRRAHPINANNSVKQHINRRPVQMPAGTSACFKNDHHTHQSSLCVVPPHYPPPPRANTPGHITSVRLAAVGTNDTSAASRLRRVVVTWRRCGADHVSVPVTFQTGFHSV